MIMDEIETKQAEQRKKTFNGLTAKEWAAYSRSVWEIQAPPRNKNKILHGATFPRTLADRLLLIYSKEGDVVLDPFMGTGTTLCSAINNRRKSVGIELTDKFFTISNEMVEEVNSKYIEQTNSEPMEAKLYKGDCKQRLKELKADSVNLTITSPPYADLLHKVADDRTHRHKHSIFVTDNKSTATPYSDDINDLGNMSIDEYTEAVKDIMKELYRITKQGGYNIWIVKDFRDTKNKIPYVDLHTKIAEAGRQAGFTYHDLIVWDQNENRRLVLLGYPSIFYSNQNHHFIVVMRKAS